MTPIMTATQSFDKVANQAHEIKCDETQYFPEAANFGDTFRQGDIYIEKIESVSNQFKLNRNHAAQLAPGTTKGSRHILDSLDGVAIYTDPEANALIGPVLLTTEKRTVVHPEHGDVILPAGCYAITYQRAYADDLRRVAD